MFAANVNDGASGMANVGGGVPCCCGGQICSPELGFGRAAAPGEWHNPDFRPRRDAGNIELGAQRLLLASFWVSAAGGAINGVTTRRRDSGVNSQVRNPPRHWRSSRNRNSDAASNNMCSHDEAAAIRAQWRPSTRSGVIRRKVGSAWVAN